MQDLLIIAVHGIGAGAIFALVGMSFNVVFNASGILNFAQGNLLVLGGLFALLTLPGEPSVTGWLVLLPIAAIVLAALVAIQGGITLLPLRSSVEQHSWLITTLAASVIISGVLMIYQGSAQPTVHSPFAGFRLMGMRVPASYALATLLAILWYVALYLFHTRMLTGLAMSAISQDLDAARAAGLRVRRLQILSFAISGLIVGSAGFVAAPVMAIASDSGISYVMNGFVAAVIGGIGSNLGALIGGFLVGVITSYAAFNYGGEFQDAVALALLVGVLMLRPQGLLGRPAARRV
ncbi:MAG TPA: branched-chain amino acid ABC transporter permease [Acetobacteraceae bacterium]|nr:branched-chain amino acid ABC transporter permease [Acetobacteraceae bacterium]